MNGPPDARARSHPPHTALIIEDDRALLDMIAEVLEQDGFVTTKVDTGSGGLRSIETQRFDVVVIDVRLPDIDGMTLCAAARDRYGFDTVILVVTAESSTERLMTAMELGADDFVPKPFDIHEFTSRVNTCLARAGNPKKP